MSEIAELRVSLTVRDFTAAVALYRDALGLSVVADWDGPNGAGVADLRMQYVSLVNSPQQPRGFTGSDITGGR